jgi:hypothetical protein
MPDERERLDDETEQKPAAEVEAPAEDEEPDFELHGQFFHEPSK